MKAGVTVCGCGVDTEAIRATRGGGGGANLTRQREQGKGAKKSGKVWSLTEPGGGGGGGGGGKKKKAPQF